jgi:hypothetical protein
MSEATVRGEQSIRFLQALGAILKGFFGELALRRARMGLVFEGEKLRKSAVRGSFLARYAVFIRCVNERHYAALRYQTYPAARNSVKRFTIAG